MAVSKQEVIIEFDADTGEAEKNIQSLEKSTEGVGKAAEESALGFKAVGTAIKATGIGLLVAVLAKLVEKFSENKKVADAFAVAGAALGTVFNQIIELAVSVGEKLSEAFTNPQEALANFKDALVNNITARIEGLLKLLPRLGEAISAAFSGDFAEAGQIATDAVAQVALGVEDFTEKVGEAAEAVQEYVQETTAAVASSTALEKELQKLRDAERNLSVETAQQAANVEELKRQRDDERLSIDERIKAAEEAAAIDQRIASENVRIQEEKARLLAEEIALQGETEERLQALADAQIAAADARAASAGVQTELMTSLYALNQELIEQGRTQLEQLQETRDSLNEERAQAEVIEQEIADRTLMGQMRQTEIVESESQKRRRIRQEEFEVFKEFVLKDQETVLNIAGSTLGALSELNAAFAGDTEKQQKKAFERSKKVQAAQALISTYESAVNAFKSLSGIPVVGPALGTAASVAAIASGLAQVKNIKSQTFGGGGGTAAAPAPAPSLSAAATEATQAPSAPTLDLSFLGDIATTPQPQQAYVISENVTTAQQANKKIQDQAAL